MPRKKKQHWDAGSIFLLPLQDEEFGLGQVIAHEYELLNSAAVAFFDWKEVWTEHSVVPQPSLDSIISVVHVTVDLLDSGRWRVVSHAAASPFAHLMPYEQLRLKGFVGGKVHGSALAESFLNAFYGLEAWDDWYLPDYLDSFLISPDKKPFDRLVYSGRYPVPQPSQA